MPNSNLETDLVDWTGCEWVESVADRMNGTPVLINSRMPADSVVENYDDGISVEELVTEYRLEHTSVLGVLRFARRLKQATAA